MKKRPLSLALALVMVLALLPMTAFAADGPSPYTVSGYGPNDEPFDTVTRDITLRNVTETPTFSGPVSSWYLTYTRDAELNTFSDLVFYVLPVGGRIVIDGLRTGSDPTDWVSVSAWSDPDGDGIFDQQLFVTSASAAPVPTLDEGPFESRYDGSTEHGYMTSSFILQDDSLGGDLNDAQSVIEISAKFLTDLFGPDTIYEIGISTRGYDEEGQYGVSGQASYLYYIPADGSDPAPAPSFTDVSADAWYADPVAWAVDEGITNGTSATAFSPAQDCTHAQILTFLYRAAGEPAPSGKAPVTVASAYAAAVDWAYGEGMIDGDFDPSAPCTRSQAVSYIWQALDEPSAQASGFTDVPADAPYAKAVDWAVEKGVTNGTSGTTFSPDQVCSRGHIVTFLYRAYND